MRLSQKIKKFRQERGWTQSDLAKFSGVSLGTIKRYELDTTNPTQENLIKIADAFNIKIKNLYDEILSPNLSPKNLNFVPQSPNLSTNLSPNPSNLKPQNDMINIPVLHHISVSAGSGAINETPEDVELRGFTRESLRENFGVMGDYQDLFIMHSFGNSMFPTIPQNALLLVQKGSPLEGQICVARIGAEMFVKRIAKYPKIELLSDNKDYKPIPVTEEVDFEIIGRVVGYFGSL